MIMSMTGYGRVETPVGDKNLIIEIKSLNGKQLDINCRISSLLRPFESDIRKAIQQKLVRGSVECIVTAQQNGVGKPMYVNTALAKNYYHSIVALADDLGLDKENILPTLLTLPEVVGTEEKVISREEWQLIAAQLQKVLDELVAFRAEEGKALREDMSKRCTSIMRLLGQVKAVDGERAGKIRERITKALSEIQDTPSIDQNRLEQELIYYIEKIDISEEKQRLQQHCELFLELLEQENESGIGKKLNFVLQEMGREINTLGSKANDAGIQRIVVEMKDELEKAKEQSLNVL